MLMHQFTFSMWDIYLFAAERYLLFWWSLCLLEQKKRLWNICNTSTGTGTHRTHKHRRKNTQRIETHRQPTTSANTSCCVRFAIDFEPNACTYAHGRTHPPAFSCLSVRKKNGLLYENHENQGVIYSYDCSVFRSQNFITLSLLNEQL